MFNEDLVPLCAGRWIFRRIVKLDGCKRELDHRFSLARGKHGTEHVKMSAVVRGDIILTTTTAAVSKAIRWGTKSDISHAMICVQHGSVIDATSEGVHARNLQHLFFDDACALHVLRLRAELAPAQLDQICQFVRQAIGSDYSTREAIRTAVGGF